jgi:hypothetical protein
MTTIAEQRDSANAAALHWQERAEQLQKAFEEKCVELHAMRADRDRLAARVEELEACLADCHKHAGRGAGCGNARATADCIIDAIFTLRQRVFEAEREEDSAANRANRLADEVSSLLPALEDARATADACFEIGWEAICQLNATNSLVPTEQTEDGTTLCMGCWNSTTVPHLWRECAQNNMLSLHELADQRDEVEAENDRLREVLEEVAKGPDPDSDLRSLMKTLQMRAIGVLGRAREALEGAK